VTALFTHDVSRALSLPTIKAKAQGIEGNVRVAVQRLQEGLKNGNFACLSLPKNHDDLPDILEAAAFLGRFRTVFILGTGGSSLGGKTLVQACSTSSTPTLHFLESVDPASMNAVLAHIDWENTGFLVISKSGGTLETLAQFLVVQAEAPKNFSWPSHARVVSEQGDGSLRQMAQRLGIQCLDHSHQVGGRYAVLSMVGLIPAALAGVDVVRLRRGAACVLDEVQEMHNTLSPPALAAVLNIAAMQAGFNQTILMPYCDRLWLLTFWFRQLWAESLGKKGLGSTPIGALGTVDQHSQLQLYLDGPADKLFTLVTLETVGKGMMMAPVDDTRLDFLRGKRLGDLQAAAAAATLDSLASHHRPIRHIHAQQWDEEAVGGLLQHFMLETVLTGLVLGIDPFDQPAVEDGKKRAIKILKNIG
jgi:glucose-6-phosphate isomerase